MLPRIVKAGKLLTKWDFLPTENAAFPKGDSGNMPVYVFPAISKRGRAEMRGNREFVMKWHIFLQVMRGAKGRTFGKLLKVKKIYQIVKKT
ncbi:MAG: hypothetical protein Q9M48_00300 [Rhodobacterales bacterium]|nr:hypothetical protein [Rhodobacterales bacterium]